VPKLLVRGPAEKSIREFRAIAMLAQYPSGARTKLMHHRRAPRVRELPLLSRSVQIAFVEEIAEPLLEARLGRAADKGMDVRRAEIAVSDKELEYLDVPGR
jgi:hypothetical protein